MPAGLNIPEAAAYDGDIADAYDGRGPERLVGEVAGPAAPTNEQYVGFDPASRQMYVNGKLFHIDDHKSMLESEQELRKPPKPMPANFEPVGPDEYKDYLNRIENPSMGRLVKKNFGIGVDNLQMLAGYGLQLAGAEETGAGIVEQQVKDLSYNEPYQRQASNVDSVGGAVEWFVANLAQQGPNLIESALAGTIGAISGGVAGGGANPFTAIGGVAMALGGKEGVKASILAAAKKALANKALTGEETKLLREAAAITAQQKLTDGAKSLVGRSRVQGAVGAAAASGYGTGIADVYGEQLDSGTDNRAIALALGIPYAALELLPEFAAFKFFKSGVKAGAINKLLKRGPNARGTGAINVLERGAKGLGAGAVGEGLTESAQEGLLISQNPDVDFNSREGILRLADSFAAGAGVGGALGGAGAALRRGRTKIDLSQENLDLIRSTSLMIEDDANKPPIDLREDQLVPPLSAPPPDVINAEGELWGPVQGPPDLGPEQYGPNIEDIGPMYGPNIEDIGPVQGPPDLGPEQYGPNIEDIGPVQGPPDLGPEQYGPAVEDIGPLQGPPDLGPEQYGPTAETIGPVQGPPDLGPEEYGPTVAGIGEVQGPPFVGTEPQGSPFLGQEVQGPPFVGTEEQGPAPIFDATGEPLIMHPTTGQQVPARQAVTESRNRISALEALKACLAKH